MLLSSGSWKQLVFCHQFIETQGKSKGLQFIYFSCRMWWEESGGRSPTAGSYPSSPSSSSLSRNKPAAPYLTVGLLCLGAEGADAAADL